MIVRRRVGELTALRDYEIMGAEGKGNVVVSVSIEDFYEIEPYSLEASEKQALLLARLNHLSEVHYKGCEPYRGIVDRVYGDGSKGVESGLESAADGTGSAAGVKDGVPGALYARTLEDVPFLPVALFKRMELKSVPDEDVFKTMTSSGTTGQRVSKIFLDRETVKSQQKVLVEIVKSFTGAARMPMIILDCPSVVKDRAMFSARGAGILGFSMFGTKKIYAFDDEMKLDVEGIKTFLAEHEGETIFMFGFTFMIWQYFYKELKRLAEDDGVVGSVGAEAGTGADAGGADGSSESAADEAGESCVNSCQPIFNLENAVLIHGGGWKKLANEAVEKDEFKQSLHDVCGIKVENVHDYYGMVEQTGCVYMECECGHLHASIYSDVITRRMKDFSVCDRGEEGVIEVLSSLPESYPGHAILTEDVGVVLGEDDCPCGRKGKYFEIHGRMAKAEVRGCSDTFERR